MLTPYLPSDGPLHPASALDEAALRDALWYDLYNPTPQEEEQVETLLHVDIPTREEMREVESSSQLYREDGASFVTLRVVTRSEKDPPRLASITLIRAESKLITVRYSEPVSFKNFVNRVTKPGAHTNSALSLLLCFAEAIVDRDADILEEIGDALDPISTEIFSQNAAAMQTIAAADLGRVLKLIGQRGDLATRVRESLHSVVRAVPFLQSEGLDASLQARLKTLNRDTHSLLEHAMFLTTQIQFLLDSNLGLISIQQNAIMKTFAVASVIFLPPTLIGSIYGMNFAHMPELQWRYGYACAIGLMLASSVGPFLYFRAKKWL
jgi:magnesium transporter